MIQGLMRASYPQYRYESIENCVLIETACNTKVLVIQWVFVRLAPMVGFDDRERSHVDNASNRCA